MEMLSQKKSIATRYSEVRAASEAICKPLLIEDYVVQPVVDVSPPKWHLGHTTWFFERFVLVPNLPDYTLFDPRYEYVFNSYYETVGKRVIRTDRGNLTRPSVDDVYRYRKHVDRSMQGLLAKGLEPSANEVLELGLNHEEQHQELLLTDIKYILGHNPLFPAYDPGNRSEHIPSTGQGAVQMEGGVYEIGYRGEEFCFDNELGRHRVHLEPYSIDRSLVTNREYSSFIDDGGYRNFRFWHAEGWDWVQVNGIASPMYWHELDGHWHRYGLDGLHPVNPDAPVTHISFYEASAYAAWKGKRLPTEFEWEAASSQFKWGCRWEWTASAYLPYPGFTTAKGALGEYNGKFMVNQMVLRGASIATAPNHSRATYRNFFHPHLRWQFTGIRLAE